MIKFRGYDEVIGRVYKHNQDHVFKYWDELADKEREGLLRDLESVDFELMEELYRDRDKAGAAERKFEPAPYVPVPSDSEGRRRQESARLTGIEHLTKGKTAALLVAGGQGTRLGFDGPKGMFPIGPVSGKTLFEIFAEKIIKYSDKYGVKIPWLIMTSEANNGETVDYFKDKGYFGLPEKDIIFFTQNMIPSLDGEGKLILQSKKSVAKNPDGHGGTLTALNTSGVLKEMDDLGIETISYFQVDNPLIKIIDPVFIGYHIMNNSDVSSKGVRKTEPGEKVGVLVRFEDGSYGIKEYSDLTEEEKNASDPEGNLLYCMGNPAIHIFSLDFIEKITSGRDLSLPYHIARKKIESFYEGEIKKIDGIKFEKFIFDSLGLTEKNTILEIEREEEFAPVKNAEGVDSPDSARGLMVSLHRKWLTERNIDIPREVEAVEISPLLAVEPGDLESTIRVPPDNCVLLESCR